MDDTSTDKLVEAGQRSIEERLRDFGALLNDIDNLSDKKRQLWREIYENAISDRQNAYAMFIRLVALAADRSSEHAVHGKSIGTYMERMSRANDQLIKLAELIAKADPAQREIDPEELYKKMGD